MRKATTRIVMAILAIVLMMPSAQAAFVTTPKEAKVVTTEEKEIAREAVREFRSLGHQEQLARVQEASETARQMKMNGNMDDNTVLAVILAIILPPVGVLVHEGGLNSKFWISLLLTLLFWFPGVIYSLLVVLDVI